SQNFNGMKYRSKKQAQGSLPPALQLLIGSEGSEPVEYMIENSVTIGRDEDTDICVDHELVSRRHAEIFFENGPWGLRNLQSRNGIYIQSKKIEECALAESTVFSLGRTGPQVIATTQQPLPATPSSDSDVLSRYAGYYFKESAQQSGGERTIFIRRA